MIGRVAAERRSLTTTFLQPACICLHGMELLSAKLPSRAFENIYPYLNQDPFGSSGMDLALANTIQGLGHYVREFSADLIVVHGDRIEALAGATVGALHNILVAHIEGGEVSGTVDELLRHAISKLSHLHFVANQESRNRLMQMGEQPDAVFVIGSPDIDVMLSGSLPSLNEVKSHYEIPFDDYCIFIYHPVTTELAGLEERASGRCGRHFWHRTATLSSFIPTMIRDRRSFCENYLNTQGIRDFAVCPPCGLSRS